MRKRQTALRIVLRGFGVALAMLVGDIILLALFDYAPAQEKAVVAGVLVSIIVAIDEMESGK